MRDYRDLQQLLLAQEFEKADRLTILKLCTLAGPLAEKRGWVYFSEVDRFDGAELLALDQLWINHSEGRFGYSVQRKIWLSVNKNYDKLWPLIGWKNGNDWTRYPEEFIWNLTAPKGHFPSTNQLRGVRVLNSLFMHPVWSDA